jgi:hypothetical protein
VDNDRTRNYIDEVISKIINNDVCWVSTVGRACEKNHDLMDEEIAKGRILCCQAYPVDGEAEIIV